MNAELFKATIKYYMTLRHIKTLEQLRSHTSVGSNKTFLKYFNNPDLIPMGILLQIIDALKIPDNEKESFLKKIL